MNIEDQVKQNPHYQDIETVQNLLKRIEDLKCCGNCLYYKSAYLSDYYGDDVFCCTNSSQRRPASDANVITLPSDKCDNWEARTWI